eukprot:m.65000 g.65000  ORF g.65000 m.65000 type:complete len:512 (+) comp14023_c0_seq1:71-1606(+)
MGIKGLGALLKQHPHVLENKQLADLEGSTIAVDVSNVLHLHKYACAKRNAHPNLAIHKFVEHYRQLQRLFKIELLYVFDGYRSNQLKAATLARRQQSKRQQKERNISKMSILKQAFDVDVDTRQESSTAAEGEGYQQWMYRHEAIQQLSQQLQTTDTALLYYAHLQTVSVHDTLAQQAVASSANPVPQDQHNVADLKWQPVTNLLDSTRNETVGKELGELASKARFSVLHEDVLALQALLQQEGIDYIVANDGVEAETVCASLTQQGIASSVWSRDYDCLALNATAMLFGLRTFASDMECLQQEGGQLTYIQTQRVIAALQLPSAAALRWLCLLLGTDFNPKAQIGTARALELAQTHTSLSAIWDALGAKRVKGRQSTLTWETLQQAEQMFMINPQTELYRRQSTLHLQLQAKQATLTVPRQQIESTPQGWRVERCAIMTPREAAATMDYCRCCVVLTDVKQQQRIQAQLEDVGDVPPFLRGVTLATHSTAIVVRCDQWQRDDLNAWLTNG